MTAFPSGGPPALVDDGAAVDGTHNAAHAQTTFSLQLRPPGPRCFPRLVQRHTPRVRPGGKVCPSRRPGGAAQHGSVAGRPSSRLMARAEGNRVSPGRMGEPVDEASMKKAWWECPTARQGRWARRSSWRHGPGAARQRHRAAQKMPSAAALNRARPSGWRRAAGRRVSRKAVRLSNSMRPVRSARCAPASGHRGRRPHA